MVRRANSISQCGLRSVCAEGAVTCTAPSGFCSFFSGVGWLPNSLSSSAFCRLRLFVSAGSRHYVVLSRLHGGAEDLAGAGAHDPRINLLALEQCGTDILARNRDRLFARVTFGQIDAAT